MSLGLLYQFADTCEKVQRYRNICACANSGHLDLLRAGSEFGLRDKIWVGPGDEAKFGHTLLSMVTFAFPLLKICDDQTQPAG